jgi:periplasmic divalent cation tolerance protein
MASARKFALALVTAPDLKTARRLARLALEARLAACVNLVGGLESHYWWQGKLERGQEVLLILKTSRRRLAPLERLILANHPYDTAEFIACPLDHGAPRYLAWLHSSLLPLPGK